MQKLFALFFLISWSVCVGQQSDFKNISFTKADKIAKLTKSKRLFELNKLTLNLTKNLNTDIEKARAIYKWICLNVANDYKLFAKNNRKRKKLKNDSVKLAEWNSELKRELFSKLLKNKRTICTGYAYLFKEMCNIADIECKMVYGFGKTVDFMRFDPDYPNHTWNAIKIDNKWYLCDATWTAGITLPSEGYFKFNYSDGYFLTEPELFLFNHYPIQKEFFLLENIPSFQEFVDAPLLYRGAYEILKNHISPKKMHHEIYKDSIVEFKYQLKKDIDIKKLKFIAPKGDNDIVFKPIIKKKDDILILKHHFKKSGYYDFHLYLNKEIIATYTFNVTKNN